MTDTAPNTGTLTVESSAIDLDLRAITKDFTTAAGTLPVLQGVDLALSRGDAVAVTGPSGSGKSTLLYIIGTLDEATSGTVSVLGKDLQAMSEQDMASFRNSHIGFIFQDHHLLPQCTVLENILVPLLAGAGVTNADETRAQKLLERVGLAERAKHRPAQLSGGERQRVAVCRALINEPEIVLADEPTGNLDQATAESIGELLLELSKEQNVLLMCVTHSGALAKRFPKHLELQNGQLADVSV
jgi:lipoprotein-releasing system ATP-binding protein